MRTIFLIIQDPNLRSLLSAEFKEEGFTTIPAEDAPAGHLAIPSGAAHPDLIILETAHPDFDPLVLEAVHSRAPGAPILGICAGREPMPSASQHSEAWIRILRRPVSIGAVVRMAKKLLGLDKGDSIL